LLMFPLLLKVFIALCSCPTKKFESYTSVKDVLVEGSLGDVNLICKHNPILDFAKIHLWCLLQ